MTTKAQLFQEVQRRKENAIALIEELGLRLASFNKMEARLSTGLRRAHAIERRLKQIRGSRKRADAKERKTLRTEYLRAQLAWGEDTEQLAARLKRVSSAMADFERSRRELIAPVTQYVVKIAKGYNNRGLTIEDLVGYGNLGAMEAAVRYDFRRNVRILASVRTRIKKEVLAAIRDLAPTIRCTSTQFDRYIRIKWETQRFVAEHGEQPSLTWLAKKCKLTEEQVETALVAYHRLVSLDAEYGEGTNKTTLGRVVSEDLRRFNTDQQPIETLRRNLYRVFDEFLGEREAEIMKMRTAADGAYTLEEIGDDYGLTKERIRQIEKKAKEKLRQPVAMERLRSYGVII